MKTVEMYSIKELLRSDTFKFHRTKLSEFLKVSRNTLSKYLDDDDCKEHCVLKIDGKFIFRAGKN